MPALRPLQTKRILDLLERGSSVHVYGTEEMGIDRLTTDVISAAPSDVTPVSLSMKLFASSFEDFTRALLNAFGIVPDVKNNWNTSLNLHLERNPTSRIWLIITHFERLESKYSDSKLVDTNGFDLYFLTFLNGLKNRSSITLFLTSDALLKTTELVIGEKTVHGSVLEFSETEQLQTLTWSDTLDYLKTNRQDDFFSNDGNKELLTIAIGALAKSKYPLVLMNELCTKDLSGFTVLSDFEKLLTKIEKDIVKQHKFGIERNLNSLETFVRRVKKITGRCLSSVNSLKRIYKIWWGILALSGSAILYFWDRIAKLITLL